MADYRDVMNARHEADSRRADLVGLAGQIEDGSNPPLELCQLLALEAVCLEIRALGMIIDYGNDALIRATGRV